MPLAMNLPHKAFHHEGYEALAGVNFVSHEGIEQLVNTAVELLQQLWEETHEE